MKNTVKILICLALVLCSILLVSCDPKVDPNAETTPQQTTAGDPIEENNICAEGSHVYESWETVKEASCGTAGKKTSVCKTCGKVAEEEIAATGLHNIVLSWGENSTKIFKKCSVCDSILETQTVTASAGATNIKLSSEGVNAELSAYTVVYAQSEENSIKDTVSEYLAKDIGKSATVKISANNDTADQVSKEILIGDTNRAESAAAKALLPEKGFVITVIDSKIAIVGSDDIQTVCAVNYFIENYIGEASVPKTAVVTAGEADVTFSAAYTFVFDDKLDDTAGNTLGTTSSKNARDYPCIAADQLIKNMNISTQNQKRSNDSDVAELEVLIGNVDREAYSDFIATLAENEYGILVKGGKIILAGYNDLAIVKSVSCFKEILNISKSGSAWKLYEGFCIKGSVNTDWIVDFTRPAGENISLYNTMDSNDDSLQFLYTGSGVNAAAFDDYCQQLIGEGYTVLTENTIENSKFKTLVNNTKGITLHVSYNDFKYESEYAVQDKFYVDYEKCIRVISAPISSVDLPTEDMVTENPSYTKVANSAMTVVGLTHRSVGMNYVIRLEDGSFIIFDGGYIANGYEHINLWKVLRELHFEAYGSYPSADNPIRIAAWVITHSHSDHYFVFKAFTKLYGKDPDIKIEALIGNFPATNVLYAAAGTTSDIKDLGVEGTISTFQSQVTGGFKYIKAHSGQTFYFANVKMEVLMTYEDHNPANIQGENDTCTIVRLTIATTDAQSGAKTSAQAAVNTVTAIFLGDAQRYQSRYMCAMYGDYLASDIVQLAHHGNIGCETPIYDAISASVVLWPECENHVPMYMNPENIQSGFYYEVDQYVADMPCVRYIIGSDSHIDTTFDFTADGPDYDSLYDIQTKEAIEYDDITLIKK